MHAQLCLISCDPMNCSLSGSCAHGIIPARILGVGCLFLPPPGIFPIQDETWHLLHLQVDSSPLNHHGSPLNTRHSFPLNNGKLPDKTTLNFTEAGKYSLTWDWLRFSCLLVMQPLITELLVKSYWLIHQVFGSKFRE